MNEYKPTKTDIKAVANALIAIIDVVAVVLPTIKENLKNGKYDELIVEKIIDCITEDTTNEH